MQLNNTTQQAQVDSLKGLTASNYQRNLHHSFDIIPILDGSVTFRMMIDHHDVMILHLCLCYANNSMSTCIFMTISVHDVMM